MRIENLSAYPSDESHGHYTFIIQTVQQPAINVTINGPTFVGACERGEWSVTPTGGIGNYTFAWYVDSMFETNGNPYARYNDNTYTENFILRVYVSDGINTVTDSKQVYFEGCSSGSRFAVYPNPATDYFEVEQKERPNTSKALVDFEVKLFDSKTRELSTSKFGKEERKVRIPVKSFPQDNYFLHILYDDAIIKKQVQIKRN